MRLHISQKVAVSIVFVAVMFISIMDVTIVNVALPTIGRELRVSATDVDVISIAFLVSLAVFIPASGWLGDRRGGKRVLLASTMYSAVRQLGGAVGVARLATVIVAVGAATVSAGPNAANPTAYRIAILVATAIALAACSAPSPSTTRTPPSRFRRTPPASTGIPSENWRPPRHNQRHPHHRALMFACGRAGTAVVARRTRWRPNVKTGTFEILTSRRTRTRRSAGHRRGR